MSRSVVAYHHLYTRVLDKRLRHVSRIALLAAPPFSAWLYLPHTLWKWALLLALLRAPALFVAFWLVQRCRRVNSTVDYSQAKTLAAQMASLADRRFASVFFHFCASAAIVYGVFLSQMPLCSQYFVLSKEFRPRPLVNDEWTYFWFHTVFCAWLYAAQHLVFQRNRLAFEFGVQAVKPRAVLFLSMASLAGNAVLFTVLSLVSAPFVYFVLRSAIYRANWLLLAVLRLDSAVPPFHISFGTLLNVAYVSFATFLAWEFLSHCFSTYATIGCLDGSQPISAASPDPVATLISGLLDVEADSALSRLTAFQELAYIAVSKDGEKMRNIIFNVHEKGPHVWPAIMDECSLVIKALSSRVNFRSKSDLAALKKADLAVPDEPAAPAKDEHLFGNSFDTANDTTQFAITATSSPKKEALEPPKSTPLMSVLGRLLTLQQSAQPLFAHLTKKHLLTTKLPFNPGEIRKNVIGTATFYREQFLASLLGAFLRITLKRDAESRVVNTVNYGNAVIALSGLLAHAVEEDRSHTVTSAHISEILNLLERPIRSCSNYTDILPASVYLTPQQKGSETLRKLHLVAVLHDLTMTEFFSLCVKYNYKLNDLLLSARAFKLAKWVIDASIAQQQKQEKETAVVL